MTRSLRWARGPQTLEKIAHKLRQTALHIYTHGYARTLQSLRAEVGSSHLTQAGKAIVDIVPEHEGPPKPSCLSALSECCCPSKH